MFSQQNNAEELTGLSWSAPLIFWGIIGVLLLLLILRIVKKLIGK